ncbi:MAG: tetraacyldisaccharide 4'-kinase [Vicinamibacterales bacterium]
MSPLSGLYGKVTRLRRSWYGRHPDRQRRLAGPVVSVGNIATGGSGKTPVVAFLARLLRDGGERPAILSRGYGRLRPADGVVVVSAGADPLVPTRDSGDEPQMLARSLRGVPVLVCADRFLAGRLAERRFATTVSLLDDGFQHVQLARDVDLVLMAPADLDDRVLPSGRLREPLAAARLADAVLVPGTPEDVSRVGAALGHTRVFQVSVQYGAPRLVDPFGAPTAGDGGRTVVAVAAIARPQRFFSALRAGGWDVVREITFRDHHWFGTRDLKAIHTVAHDVGAAAILTTEKDAVRLDHPGEPGSACVASVPSPPWLYLPMEVTIDPPDIFAAWLAARLADARVDVSRRGEAGTAEVSRRSPKGEGG